MANNVIQIKRSPNAAAPATLAAGELAWIDDGGAGTLYIGDAATGAIKTIGGNKAGDWGTDFRTDTALLGTTTMANLTAGAGAFDFTSATTITAPTQAPNDSSDKVATTQYVNDRINVSGGAFSTLTDTDFSNLANGHLAIYDADADGGNGKWENHPISGGHVTMSKDGVMQVVDVQAGAIDLTTDTASPYVATITNTDTNLAITNSGGTNAGVGIDLAANVTISGDLVVQGQTTTVDSTTVTLSDPVLVLGTAVSGASNDSGVEFNYDDGAAKKGYFGWDRSSNVFTFIPDASNTGEVFTGTAGNAKFNEVEAEISTAVQTQITTMANLTTVGTISTGVWEGTEIAQNKGGTGRTSGTADQDLLVGAATGGMTTLSLGSAGQHLSVNAAGTAMEWSDAVDGGTF